MYFYRLKGRQILDLRGNLILTHNDELVKARVKSAAPAGVRNTKYIIINGPGFVGRLKTTMHAIRFIWGPSEALDIENEDL